MSYERGDCEAGDPEQRNRNRSSEGQCPGCHRYVLIRDGKFAVHERTASPTHGQCIGSGQLVEVRMATPPAEGVAAPTWSPAQIFETHPLPWTHHCLMIKDANGRQVIHTGGSYDDRSRLYPGDYLSGLNSMLVEKANAASSAGEAAKKVLELVWEWADIKREIFRFGAEEYAPKQSPLYAEAHNLDAESAQRIRVETRTHMDELNDKEHDAQWRLYQAAAAIHTAEKGQEND